MIRHGRYAIDGEACGTTWDDGEPCGKSKMEKITYQETGKGRYIGVTRSDR
jgi:hypothetical protein